MDFDMETIKDTGIASFFLYHLGCIQLAWHKLHLDFMEWPFVTLQQQQQQQHKLYFHLNFGVASEPMHCIIGCY